MTAILRKPETRAELDDLEAQVERQQKKVTTLKRMLSTPWRDIETEEQRLDELYARIKELRRGAAA